MKRRLSKRLSVGEPHAGAAICGGWELVPFTRAWGHRGVLGPEQGLALETSPRCSSGGPASTSIGAGRARAMNL